MIKRISQYFFDLECKKRGYTQKQWVESVLHRERSITQQDARRRYGVRRLAAIIYRLETEEGYDLVHINHPLPDHSRGRFVEYRW